MHEYHAPTQAKSTGHLKHMLKRKELIPVIYYHFLTLDKTYQWVPKIQWAENQTLTDHQEI